MTAGWAGLTLWSFLMATGHGAGLMILPALMPLCAAAIPSKSPEIALAAVGLHMAAMLAVSGAVAVIVYKWAGLAILKSAWINVDLLWTLSLAAAGTLLLVFS
jgi:hypothetical protein